MGDLSRMFYDPAMNFLFYSFLTGAVSSIAFGITGAYVVTRKISSIAGAIAHCVLGGIGLALFLKVNLGWNWCTPLYGAIVSALFSAIVIGIVSIYAKQREDTVIGAIWAIGMALGLLFIAWTPGYFDLNSYLFGNILLVTKNDFLLTLLLDVLILIPAVLFFNNFMAVCFDGGFAGVRGVKVNVFYIMLLCMTALTIVLMVTIVGIIMVIALITLPAAAAGQFTRRLWSMMTVSVILSFLITTGGLAVSYNLNLPSGPLIVVIAGIVYLCSIVFAVFFRSDRKSKT